MHNPENHLDAKNVCIQPRKSSVTSVADEAAISPGEGRPGTDWPRRSQQDTHRRRCRSTKGPAERKKDAAARDTFTAARTRATFYLAARIFHSIAAATLASLRLRAGAPPAKRAARTMRRGRSIEDIDRAADSRYRSPTRTRLDSLRAERRLRREGFDALPFADFGGFPFPAESSAHCAHINRSPVRVAYFERDGFINGSPVAIESRNRSRYGIWMESRL